MLDLDLKILLLMQVYICLHIHLRYQSSFYTLFIFLSIGMLP